MMEITLGTRTLSTPSIKNARFTLLLWGMAGCGKTTLAATAPGVKLWILFDPDGTNSLIGREDILVLNLAAETHFIVEKLKDDNPFGLEKVLKEHPEIETIVFDSVTAFSVLATENAVFHVKSATIENPGLKGYGHRNSIVLRAISAINRLAAKLNKNFICIGHEATPDKDQDGNINFITLALGGTMVNQVGASINEVWWLSDTGKQRRIAVRPVRTRTPMKTRMFDISDPVGEFVWKYDAATQKGDGINTWFQQWKTGNGAKIPIPK